MDTLTLKELKVIHAALVYFVETEDYTDEESVIITELLEKCNSKFDDNGVKNDLWGWFETAAK